MPAAVTCTARVGSDANWKQQDPQLPKSIWYLTDAQWLGFRLVRPAKLPSADEMFQYWNNGVEHDEQLEEAAVTLAGVVTARELSTE